MTNTTNPQPQGCRVCGGFGQGVEHKPSRYVKGEGQVRKFTVTHRGGNVHTFETNNVPQTDPRKFTREVQ